MKNDIILSPIEEAARIMLMRIGCAFSLMESFTGDKKRSLMFDNGDNLERVEQIDPSMLDKTYQNIDSYLETLRAIGNPYVYPLSQRYESLKLNCERVRSV